MKKLLLISALLFVSLGPSHGQTVQAKNTVNTTVVIATGSTFQTILAAVSSSAGRQSLTIQNNNITTDNCWVKFGVGVTAGNATKQTSILLLPGGSLTRYWPFVPKDEIEATCTTTGNSLYVDTQ